MFKLADFPKFEESVVDGGHSACPGCGSTTALRMVMSVLGKRTVCFVPASCASLYFGIEHGTTTVPVVNTVYSSAFCQAAGYSYALRMREDHDTQVVVWGGDGAFYDIGMDGLSHIAAQNFDVMAICNDNEGYQNTGGHSSSATPKGTRTKITPFGYKAQAKNLMEIMAAHRIPYAATISAAFPEDMRAKLRKATTIRGMKFLHLLTSCVQWQHAADIGIHLVRKAVNCGAHPLYEIFNGEQYIVNYVPRKKEPVDEYLSLQGRFRDLDPGEFQKEVDRRWDELWLRARGAVRAA